MVDLSLQERLAELMKLSVPVILGNLAHRQEYIEIHTLIEGSAPSCIGCGAKTRLKAWKKKYSNGKAVVSRQQKINKKMNNTFTLHKKSPRLSIPFTGKVITAESTDELVQYYLDQATTEAERARREAFFIVLPEVATPKVVAPKKKTAKKKVADKEETTKKEA